MTELIGLLAQHKLETVIAAAVLYVILSGEFVFRFPRRPGKPEG